ncbi:MAG: beta-ketoacyl synthase chain length factor [Polyangiales bacterium]
MNVHVRGHAFWAPGYASMDAFESGDRDESLERPAIAFVDSRMKRATSLMTRMSVHCVAGAIESSGLPLDGCATVFGSEHGEIQIAVDQMVMMQDGEGRISPARFKNSVHNTAAGLFSIAAKNKGFTTALAAGADTFPLSLLEGMALLKAGDAKHVVIVVADEPLPQPIAHASTHTAMAIALALSTEKGPGPEISLPVLSSAKTKDTPPSQVPEAFAEHCGAAAYRLLVAIRNGERGKVRLNPSWEVEVS